MVGNRFKHALLGTGVLIVAALTLPGCDSISTIAIDQPISMTIEKGAPIIAWCTDAETLTRVQIVYSSRPDDLDSKFIEAEGIRVVGRNEKIDVYELVHTWDPSVNTVSDRSIGSFVVTLYFARPGSKEGWFGVELREKEGRDVLKDWPAGKWGWADGTVSNDACGMGSASVQ